MTTTPPPSDADPVVPPAESTPPTPTAPVPADRTEPSSITSPRFWVNTAERAIKTAAQVLVVILVAKTAGTGGVDIATMDWPTALGLAGGAALLSVLTSLASRSIGPDHHSPSVV
jgi:Putative lactococcus lactis phage r1t holin